MLSGGVSCSAEGVGAVMRILIATIVLFYSIWNVAWAQQAPAEKKQPAYVVIRVVNDERPEDVILKDLMEAPFLQAARNYDSDNRIAKLIASINLPAGDDLNFWAGKFNPEQKSKESSPLGGMINFESHFDKKTGATYYIGKAPVGYHAIYASSFRTRWLMCYNASAVYFKVEPEEVLFLGDFNASAESKRLNYMTATRVVPQMSYGELITVFDVNSDLFMPYEQSAYESSDLKSQIDEFVSKTVKRNVSTRAATIMRSDFPTGRDPFGVMKQCVGYHSGKGVSKNKN